MKDLNKNEFIHYIDDIRNYIYLYNSNNFEKITIHRELLEIENFLFEQNYLSFKVKDIYLNKIYLTLFKSTYTIQYK